MSSPMFEFNEVMGHGGRAWVPQQEASDRLLALDEVYHWAQATLTAWNTGDLPKECPLHHKLREVLIKYRQTLAEIGRDAQ